MTAARCDSVVQLSSMSSQAGPIWGICRKWSITHSESTPSDSAWAAIARSRGPSSAGDPRPAKRGTCSPNDRAPGAAAGAGGSAGAVSAAIRAGATSATAGRGGVVGEHVHGRERLRGDGVGDGPPLGQLGPQHRLGHPLGAALVAPAHLGRRDVEHDGHARHAGPLGRRPPAGPAGGVRAERVDHRREPPPQAHLDDVVEQPEGVGGRPEVVLALAGQRPQPVGRHHLGPEVGLGPRRLARPRRPDEHDEARRRQLQHGCHCLAAAMRLVQNRRPDPAPALQRLRRPHQTRPGRVVQNRRPDPARRALQRLRRPHQARQQGVGGVGELERAADVDGDALDHEVAAERDAADLRGGRRTRPRRCRSRRGRRSPATASPAPAGCAMRTTSPRTRTRWRAGAAAIGTIVGSCGLVGSFASRRRQKRTIVSRPGRGGRRPRRRR